MLKIHIDGKELWDEQKEEFYNLPGCDLELEHSLYSISKWESKYHKSFINSQKTPEETVDYIKMMVLNKDDQFEESSLFLLTQEQLNEIGEYINDPMTATTFSEEDEKELTDNNHKNHFTTSEEIYSWMCAQQIPFECQHWHLNRLITLIKICAINNKPKDKKKKRMTSSDLALRRAKMEAARNNWKNGIKK